MSQEPVLFSGSIAENIAYGNFSATIEQIHSAAEKANCDFVFGNFKSSLSNFF